MYKCFYDLIILDGAPKTKVVTLCRNAIKTNNIFSLIQVSSEEIYPNIIDYPNWQRELSFYNYDWSYRTLMK
jgi:hypothetical protein